MTDLKWCNPALVADLVPTKTDNTAFTVPDNKDEIVFVAKLAEQTERYDEMVLCMRKLVKLNSELNQDERNLLSVAYKNVIGPRRAAWRIVTSIEQREQEKGVEENLPVIVSLRQQYETELASVCEDLLQLLESYLIPAAPSAETKVFYYKMKGDYHRYYAETVQGDQQKQKALEAYKQAKELAEGSLPPTNAIRLGLMLNLSVFHYEIMKQTDEGFTLAKEAFDDARTEGTETDDEATLIIQLLQDNIGLWTEDRAQPPQ